MAEVMHAMSTVEGRPEEQVYADLLATFADVGRIRIDDADAESVEEE